VVSQLLQPPAVEWQLIVVGVSVAVAPPIQLSQPLAVERLLVEEKVVLLVVVSW
jgi:hypothetical protein